MSNSKLMGRLLQSTILLGAATVTPAFAPAFAQEGVDEATDTIVVTGSRIQRLNVEAPSPVASVDAGDLRVVNTVNTEDYLNDLPQLVPAFDSTSNNPGDGTATLSLRGLGTNRTLILVDGKRFVGNGIGQVVDINNIPTALLQRVDVVTGGASAVYGSDAVAGVINFILKDDFEGLELDASVRQSEQSDGTIQNYNVTMGANFDDDRGNAVLSFGYTNRDALFQGDRDFSRNTLVDAGPDADFGFGGSINIPSTFFFPPSFVFDFTEEEREAAGCNDADNSCPFGSTIGDDGELRPFINSGQDQDRYNYAPVNYLQLPQERYNITALANYDITDNVEAYARGLFTHVLVDSQLAPTPAFETGLRVDVDNPFLGDRLIQAFEDAGLRGEDTDGDGSEEFVFGAARRYEELGFRNSLRDTNTFQIVGGFRGDITSGALEGWNWDVSGQFGRSQVDEVQTGNLSRSALEDGLLDGSIDIFSGPRSISDEAAQDISRTGAIFSTVEQTVITASLGGEVSGLSSPGASTPLAIVFGSEYREEYARQQPDSVLGPDVRGFNSSVFVEGRYDVAEVFAEANLPLLEDQPFAQDLSINGAYRRSDYSSVGAADSWFVGGTWVPIDGLRFRTQFQRATRAPNIGELFATSSNGFPGVLDPCAGTNGAFRLLDDDQQTAVASRCAADGVPQDDDDDTGASAITEDNPDGDTNSEVGFDFAPQPNSQIETIFAGSDSLEAEEADTFTAGVFWQPSFAPGLEFEVDYYDIEIDNALATPPVQLILNDCYLRGIDSQCSFINRLDSGAIAIIGSIADSDGLGANPGTLGTSGPVLTANQVGLFVEGIDYRVAYRFDPNWDYGSFGFVLSGTHTLENAFQGQPGSGVFDCTGTYNAFCGEPLPENKILGQLTWDLDRLSATVRYSWIDEVVDVNAVEFGRYAETLRVSEIGAYDTIDLNAQYDVSEAIQVSFGVRNLTDEEPPLLGDCCNEQGNTYPATYDTLGRQFFLGLRGRF